MQGKRHANHQRQSKPRVLDSAAGRRGPGGDLIIFSQLRERPEDVAMNGGQGWRNGIREAFTFDDVLLKPGLSEILPSEADVRSRLTRAVPLQYSRHRLRHGHGHRSAHGDRHGAGRRHRRHPSQLRYRRAGGAGPPGQEIRIRHGGEPAHHRARREARRCADTDEGPRHLRHPGGDRRRRRQARQARRHSHQPRRALCHRSGPEGLGADDEGKSRHGARGRRPERSEAAAAPTSHREAAGGRRPVSLRRADHGEGHREGGRAIRTPARTSRGACALLPRPRSATTASSAPRG